MAVRSVLGACGTHEAVGGVRRWRRSWVNIHIHPLPAAIQVLGRRKHRSAAPTGPSVARFAVQRVPGYGSGQPCRSADVHEVAARPGVLVHWSHVMGTAAPAAIPGRTPLFSQKEEDESSSSCAATDAHRRPPHVFHTRPRRCEPRICISNFALAGIE